MATKQGSDISTTHFLMEDFADFDNRAASLRQQLQRAIRADSKTSHATKAITPASRHDGSLEESEEVYSPQQAPPHLAGSDHGPL